MLGQYEDAIKSYSKSLRLNNKNGQVHFNLGSAYSATCEFEKAEAHYQLAIKFKGNYVPAYLCLGEVYLELQDLKKAEAAFK